MSFGPLDITAASGSPNSQVTSANQQSEAAVRRMASEFEALLLRQLTSSIGSKTDDEDGESLFGNEGGGLGLSKQLFSEQLADTMSKSGGVGLADMIVKQVMDSRAAKSKASANPATLRALDTARSIREKAPAKAENDRTAAKVDEATSLRPLRNRSNRTTISRLDSAPLPATPNSPDVMIISRASDLNETPKQRFVISSAVKAAAADAPRAVSADETAATPRANSSANSNAGQRFMTEDDVKSLVRPRRVASLPGVEENSSVSNIEEAAQGSNIESSGSNLEETSSTPNSEESLPSPTRTFVPTSAPIRRSVPRPVRFPAPARTSHIPAFSHVVNAPSTRASAVMRSSSVNSATPASLSAAPVSLQMYVRGPIRSRFGPRIDPINGRHRFHTGIDIAAPAGTPIGAAAAGKVVFAGRNGGYGNMVIIEHPDGTLTRYGHAEKLLVKEGDEVSSGQAIALVGSTGHSTGPHLHFEVKKDGEFVNPLTVLPKDFTLEGR